MTKPISEMNDRELFCAMTGEYGVVSQAYLQRIAVGYKKLKGEYAPLRQMVEAALSGELGPMDEEIEKS